MSDVLKKEDSNDDEEKLNKTTLYEEKPAFVPTQYSINESSIHHQQKSFASSGKSNSTIYREAKYI